MSTIPLNSAPRSAVPGLPLFTVVMGLSGLAALAMGTWFAVLQTLMGAIFGSVQTMTAQSAPELGEVSSKVGVVFYLTGAAMVVSGLIQIVAAFRLHARRSYRLCLVGVGLFALPLSSSMFDMMKLAVGIMVLIQMVRGPLRSEFVVSTRPV